MNMKCIGVFVWMLVMAGLGFAQPIITTQPQDQTNAIGTTATFTVSVSGTEPLAYQWLRDGLDMTHGTNASLILTNVQLSSAGAYSVIITNLEGAVTSRVAQLVVASLPTGFIRSAAPYQRMAVYRGSNTSLTSTSGGTSPLSFQWRLEGINLLGQTNKTLTISNAQPEDEGDYSVVVSNPWGAITSAPVRLYVTPPAATFVRNDFTNEAQLRLPYFLLLPENLSPARSFPLVCVLHGTPGDETMFRTYADIGPQAIGAVYASYGQQREDPAIVVWPARRTGDGEWTIQYLQQVLGLVDHLVAEWKVDTNRIYVVGMSEGVHAVWDCLGARPSFFAGATVLAGWMGSSPAASIKGVPVWAFCAADDSLVYSTSGLVSALRKAGGSVIYAAYNSGGHMDGIAMGLCTPAAVDWLLGQRRGASSPVEPNLRINAPAEAFITTGAASIDLAGVAAALGDAITQLGWTNTVNKASGIATPTNGWDVTDVPLVPDKTNIVIVTATTTSWAPAFGGNTTFNDTLTVVCKPIRATLARQGGDTVLDWSGGAPPYSVQRATDLGKGDWTDFLTGAMPPLMLAPEGKAGFYRVLGQ